MHLQDAQYFAAERADRQDGCRQSFAGFSGSAAGPSRTTLHHSIVSPRRSGRQRVSSMMIHRRDRLKFSIGGHTVRTRTSARESPQSVAPSHEIRGKRHFRAVSRWVRMHIDNWLQGTWLLMEEAKVAMCRTVSKSANEFTCHGMPSEEPIWRHITTPCLGLTALFPSDSSACLMDHQQRPG